MNLHPHPAESGELSLDQIVACIRACVKTGCASISPSGKLRMNAVSLAAHDVYQTVLNGEAFACRELDRAKFVDENCVVFVAIGYSWDGKQEHAFIVSAFPHRAPKSHENVFKV